MVSGDQTIIGQRPAAIVTPIEGTTRDVLEVTLNIDGYPLVLADTAGLRSRTNDIVEKEGISRALQLSKNCDLLLLIVDAAKYLNWKQNNPSENITNYVKQYAKKLNLDDLINEEANSIEQLFTKKCVVVVNKIDIGCIEDSDINSKVDIVKFSCKTKEGLTDLVRHISEKLKILCANPCQDHPSMNQLRHRQHLEDCLKYLEIFINNCTCDNSDDESLDLVLLAEHLRKALKHLGKLVGSVTNDQLLDVIFKDFCIGK